MYAMYQGHTGRYHHTHLSVSSISILQKYRVNFLFLFYIPARYTGSIKIGLSPSVFVLRPHISSFLYSVT